MRQRFGEKWRLRVYQFSASELWRYTLVTRLAKMAGVIIKDPEILGGEPVFRGTRVPFKILIESLEGGDTLDQFLEQYPSVSRKLAIAAIEEARVSLVSRR